MNFATERASVEYIAEEVSVRDLKKVVEEAGYQVLEVKEEDIVEKERLAREAELLKLKQKFIIGAVLLIPILILMYGGSLLEKWIGLSMETNSFIQFLLATPVQFWAGWQFYVGFWKATKHKTSDMNTLIAVGTSTAYLYSLIVTFVPHLFMVNGLMMVVYFDTSAAIIVLILLGRFLEARAKGKTSARRQARIASPITWDSRSRTGGSSGTAWTPTGCGKTSRTSLTWSESGAAVRDGAPGKPPLY